MLLCVLIHLNVVVMLALLYECIGACRDARIHAIFFSTTIAPTLKTLGLL